MEKDESTTLNVRMLAADRLELEKLAAADDRPVSSLVRKIVADWLRQQERNRP